MEGRVRRICNGYFFITGDDGVVYFGIYTDILKNRAGMRPELHVSSRLRFDTVDEGQKHVRAINIRILQE